MTGRTDAPPRGAYPVIVPHPVRYNDTDRQGHVNNATFSTYFEFARTEFMFRIARGFLADGCEPVLARIEIDFRAELHFPATIDIALAIAHVGTASVRFAHAVFLGETCIASGDSIVVQVHTPTRRPQAWSEAQRALMAGYGLAG